MKTWSIVLVIIGILCMIAGVIGYYLATADWSLWGIIPIPNPFVILKPYNIYMIVVGVILFIIGWVTGRRE